MSIYVINKVRTVTGLRTRLFCAGMFLLLMPGKTVEKPVAGTVYEISVNGSVVGTADAPEKGQELYLEARRELCSESGQLLLMDSPVISVKPVEDFYGFPDSDETIRSGIKQIISAGSSTAYVPAWTVKVGDTEVCLSSADEVTAVLQDAIDKYSEGFTVSLQADPARELGVLIPVIKGQGEDPEEFLGGAADTIELAAEEADHAGFDNFDYGVCSVAFSEAVEVVEAHVPAEVLMSRGEAVSVLTEPKELEQTYKVQPGDTLSEISLKVGLPLDRIIELNDELESASSIIRPDQELLITTPEPVLSVTWSEIARFSEVYDLPTEYVYNDEWFTNKSVTITQPSAGYHEAVALITRKNDDETERQVLYEEIGMEPVAKVVEKGTIAPPSYIKPISGGRISSGFGKRSAPTAGATTYHQGVDLATPLGTPVWASSGGTVSFAGWGGGYGNVVYVDHPDGRQTRYAHLSKIYVKVGQSVNQGQVIAASGSTGRSTGPHLHFEMRIGGVAKDPRDYVPL